MDSFNIHSVYGVIRSASESRSCGHYAANGPNVSVATNLNSNTHSYKEVFNVYSIWLYKLKAPIDLLLNI